MTRHIELVRYWSELENFSNAYFANLPVTGELLPVTEQELKSHSLPFHIFEQLVSAQELDVSNFEKILLYLAPVVYQQDDLTLPLYLLPIEADKSGNIKVCEKLPYPIIPKCLLHPFAEKFSLFNYAEYEQYITVNPPEYDLGLGAVDLDVVLNYATALIEDCANVDIEQTMQAHGYKKSTTSIVVGANQFDTKKSIRIQKDLTKLYEQDVLPKYIKAINLTEEFPEPYDDTEDATVLIPAKVDPNIELTTEQEAAIKTAFSANTINYITAANYSGVETVIQEIVANVSIKSIAEAGTNLNIVKYDSEKFSSLNLLDCKTDFAWVKSSCKHTELSYPYSSHINEFLKSANQQSEVELVNLSQAKQELSKKLIAMHNVYKRGIKLFDDYDKISIELKRKYFTHGGVKKRLADLQNQLKTKTDSFKHLQVIEALWRRQLSQMPVFVKAMSFIPAVKKSRLKRIYSLLEQYFPEVELASLSIKEVEEKIVQLLRQGEFKEKALLDTIAQLESDLRQFDLIRNKYLQFCTNHYGEELAKDEFALKHFKNLQHKIYQQAYHLKEAEFLLKHSWGAVDDAKFDLQNIDLLLITNPHNISVPDFISIANYAKKIIIFGCRDLVSTINTPAIFDNILTKSLNITEFEDEYDVLDNNALLGSSSNLASLAELNFNTEICMNTVYDISPRLVTALNNTKYQMDDVELHGEDSESNINVDDLEFINIDRKAELVLGDYINKFEINKVIEYIKTHKLNSSRVKIVCATRAQAILCQDELLQAGFADFEVADIYAANIDRCEQVLFLSVFTAENKGPYSFNEGNKYIYQVVSIARDKVVVFGDSKIFDSNLMSPAGKLVNAKIEVVTEVAELFDL